MRLSIFFLLPLVTSSETMLCSLSNITQYLLGFERKKEKIAEKDLLEFRSDKKNLSLDSEAQTLTMFVRLESHFSQQLWGINFIDKMNDKKKNFFCVSRRQNEYVINCDTRNSEIM